MFTEVFFAVVPRLAPPLIFFSGITVKQAIAHPCHGILLNSKKKEREWEAPTCPVTDEWKTKCDIIHTVQYSGTKKEMNS